MKRLFSGILTLIMVVLTIGVPLYRHTCHVFDRSELSFHNEDACCNPYDNSGKDVIDFKCCSLEHLDTAFDYETLVKKADFFQATLAGLNSTFFHYQQFIEVIDESYPVLRPPPIVNNDLLAKIQVFII